MVLELFHYIFWWRCYLNLEKALWLCTVQLQKVHKELTYLKIISEGQWTLTASPLDFLLIIIIIIKSVIIVRRRYSQSVLPGRLSAEEHYLPWVSRCTCTSSYEAFSKKICARHNLFIASSAFNHISAHIQSNWLHLQSNLQSNWLHHLLEK